MHQSGILLCMRTTIDIDPELLSEAMAATGAETKRRAVELGLRALVSAAARRRLVALGGSVPDATAPERRRSDTAT